MTEIIQPTVTSGSQNQRFMWLAGATLALLVGFAPTIASFPETWNQERAHGYVVGSFCLWLLWRNRRELDQSDAAPPWIAFALACCSVLWLVATIMGIRVVHQLMFVATLTLWGVALAGRGAARVVVPIAVTFLLAVPVWEVLLGLLQSMTVAVNSVGVKLLRLPAVVSGQQIIFPFGTIEVAQSCAGLQYFMSALTIGTIYSWLFLANTRPRLVAVVLVVTLAIVSNWLRVFGLVMIGYNTKMQSPLMAEHATYGWVIFALIMVLFFVLTPRIERWDAARSPSVTSVRIGYNSNSRRVGYVLPTAVALLGPLTWGLVSLVPVSRTVSPQIDGVAPPAGWQVDGLSSRRETAGKRLVDSIAPTFSGHTEQATMVAARGQSLVRIDRFTYERQSEGREMIGSGNDVGRDVLSEKTIGPLDERLRIVRQAVVRTARGVHLVWYWYDVGGTQTASPARAKVLEAINFFRRRGSSSITAISAACGENDCADAASDLQEVATGRPRA